MLDLDTRRRGMLQDLDALIDTLDTMPAKAWNLETPCKGWRVQDLAIHLTGTIPLLEDRLAGFALGSTGERVSGSGLEEVPPGTGPGEIVVALRERRDAIASQLDQLTEADLNVAASDTQGFLAQTPELYLDLATFEAAIHRNDLDVALGDIDAPICDHGVAAIDAILASNMVNFARMTDVKPEAPLSIGFAAPSVTHTLTWTGTVWSDVPVSGIAQATVAGTDSIIMRFICGRITADDPHLTVTGDTGIARQFKTFVPGP